MHAVRGVVLPITFGGALLGALLSCKNVDEPPSPAVIGGGWVYTETLADNLFGITCVDTGTYTFNQDGPKFTGLYVQIGKCRSGGVVQFNNGHGQVTDGSVTNVRLQFTAGGLCAYTGQLSTAHDAVNAGTGICDFVDSTSGRHYSLAIDWSMTRQ